MTAGSVIFALQNHRRFLPTRHHPPWGGREKARVAILGTEFPTWPICCPGNFLRRLSMLEDTERQFQNSARVMRLVGWSLAVVLI
jgi:hypothetical protein